jgi:DNA-binding IclR family transcriptional regulator
MAFPLHCTANGKALLAEMDEEDVRALMSSGLESLTPSTIVDPEILLLEVQEIRQGGCLLGAPCRYQRDRDGTAEPVRHCPAPSVPVATTRFVELEHILCERLLAGRDRIERVLTEA